MATESSEREVSGEAPEGFGCDVHGEVGIDKGDYETSAQPVPTPPKGVDHAQSKADRKPWGSLSNGRRRS